MKFVAFGLILLCCHVWVIKAKNFAGMDDKFKEFLENFKDIMREGSETFGIPCLDPFTADKLPIDINEELINLSATLTNVRVDGLAAYTVNAGTFSAFPPKASLDLSWPLVTASTNYDMKGKAKDFDIYGKGDIKMSAKGFNTAVEVSFALKGQYVEVKEVKSHFSLQELEFYMTGFLNNEEVSELLSTIISDMVPQLIEDYQDKVTEEVNAVITQKLNNLLEGKTLSEILKMLGLA